MFRDVFAIINSVTFELIKEKFLFLYFVLIVIFNENQIFLAGGGISRWLLGSMLTSRRWSLGDAN